MRSQHPELARPLSLGPGFRLVARWNRLGETVKTRKKRGKTGKKWARYSLRSVGSRGITRVKRARLSWLLSSIRRRWAERGQRALDVARGDAGECAVRPGGPEAGKIF